MVTAGDPIGCMMIGMRIGDGNDSGMSLLKTVTTMASFAICAIVLFILPHKIGWLDLAMISLVSGIAMLVYYGNLLLSRRKGQRR
jgi:hypothetical protein